MSGATTAVRGLVHQGVWSHFSANSFGQRTTCSGGAGRTPPSLRDKHLFDVRIMSGCAGHDHRPHHRSEAVAPSAVEQAERRLPSVSAAVVRAGRTVWTGGAGRVDGKVPTTDTQYRIGSVTKTFIAVAVTRLRDAGLLALEEPVTGHLGPEWKVPALQNVSVGQLLMHTGGLPAETSGPWWERTLGIGPDELLGELAGRTVPSMAGRRFHYSNVGFAVLGGTPWHTVVTEEILMPLDMRRTTPRPQPPFAPGFAVHPWADVVLREPEHDAGVMASAGQLWSTMDDLSRWMRFIAGDTAEVLSPDTLAEMFPRLVDKSLLMRLSGQQSRFRLLETLRAYVSRMLQGQPDECPAIQQRRWVYEVPSRPSGYNGCLRRCRTCIAGWPTGSNTRTRFPPTGSWRPWHRSGI